MSRLLIVGAGGFGKSVEESASLSSNWTNIEFVDDGYPARIESEVYKIVGKTSDLRTILPRYDGVIIAIGNNRHRKRLLLYLQEFNAPIINLIDDRALVSKSASIGVGNIILAGAIVGAHARIGNGCILNPNSVADHDSIMDDYSHLGVGANLAGTAKLEEGAWLRSGVSLSYNMTGKAWHILELQNMTSTYIDKTQR